MFANTLNCLSRLNLHHVLWSAFQLVLAAASILADWRTVHEQIWHFYLSTDANSFRHRTSLQMLKVKIVALNQNKVSELKPWRPGQTHDL